ncbi:uncharacterized protein JCM6883_001435 [Sporobolomyces salmoneus]|uniref:uncharacterized protein n=1 Tax=Sporobolomyces salmoneus TaxID=183962 RepID=UPI00316F9163
MKLVPILAIFLSTSTSVVYAQLVSMRATIPGSLHQCEETTLFLFETQNSRPITIALLPCSRSPTSKNEMTLQEAIALGPLQVLNGIETPDTVAYDWRVSIASGEKFETWGFLPDGQGKNLNLPRTVMTSLPGDETTCKPATSSSSKPGGGINKATTGVIFVGKAPPPFHANTTDSAVVVVGAPLQTAVNAVAANSTTSSPASPDTPLSPASASASASTSSSSAPSSVDAEAQNASESKAPSTNSASGQVVLKWLVGGLGVVAVSLLVL